MKKIEIEDDLYRYILANIEAFGETPSQILRRLLALPALIESPDKSEAKKKVTPTSAPQDVSVVEEQSTQTVNVSVSSLSASFSHGISALFSDPLFKKEPVVTNKFKMMLTTLYHEKRAAFIAAANTTKGRTRDYFGQNLTALLASENQQEVALLKASKPHDIPNTPFWVITNANTGRKRIILTQMMTAMEYPEHLIARIQEEI